MSRDHAVVIGASMAGLLTALALHDHFADVTVIDRDRLPAGPRFRAGVPHGHLPGLWVTGLPAVERLLPGFERELRAAGARPLHLPTDALWLTPPGHWSERFPASARTLSASRPLIEWLLRARVLRAGRINLVAELDAVGLRLDRTGDATAVTARSRRTGAIFELHADLVVDAGGRDSGLPGWLAALGRPRPKEITVDADLGCATRYYATPSGAGADWKAIFLPAAPPRQLRAGTLVPIEGDRWAVTLAGGGRDHPPTDGPGFVAFAASLRDPVLHDAIATAEPVSPVRAHRGTANQRRHYETLRGMPGRLLVVGDSLCAFNPVHGQGTMVAALQVAALVSALRASAGSPSDSRRIQRAVAKVADGVWPMAAGEDLRYPGTEGAKSSIGTRFGHRYRDRVFAAAAVDPTVNAAVLRVLNMIDRPPALFRPSVITPALGRFGRPATRHTAPPVHEVVRS
ncbi:MAG TPA: FAD-binding monooxygenase [Actinophytocola sp.]|uniref:FAD-dependent oxidoreductase n=1 Tax=Actinophytocola sp. TaxID=1872138 RepID=UPI002DBEFCBA|nr:FAD-binding monooxygenase [Actinophytocola sp.]HEU5472897.1 FAD-binding monooxygenase [Actinophytocola sp.]